MSITETEPAYTTETAPAALRRLLEQQAAAWGCKLHHVAADSEGSNHPLDAFAWAYLDEWCDINADSDDCPPGFAIQLRAFAITGGPYTPPGTVDELVITANTWVWHGPAGQQRHRQPGEWLSNDLQERVQAWCRRKHCDGAVGLQLMAAGYASRAEMAARNKLAHRLRQFATEDRIAALPSPEWEHERGGAARSVRGPRVRGSVKVHPASDGTAAATLSLSMSLDDALELLALVKAMNAREGDQPAAPAQG